jgi:transcriptional regulator with XRE-family HTH domain
MKEKELMTLVGQLIRSRRKRTGLTISRLAEIVDIDQGFLATIETGKKMPSLPTAQRIAEAFDLSLAELFQPIPKSAPGPEEELIYQMRHLFRTRTAAQREDVVAILRHLRDPERARALRRVIGK